MQTEPHVVIVGGGFSGAAVAIHLLRLAQVGVRVTLLEPREVPGAGVAYSTTEPSHRINVPAARMQLAGEEEGAFDRWYRSQPAFAEDPQALLEDGAVYPQRGQFGRYVAQRFAEEARASAGRLTHLREQALSIHHGEVVTDSGRRLSADLLVLAISHPPPSLPTLTMPFATHPALIANPWRAGVLEAIAPEASVAIVGTGLTMADTVATLTRLGHRGPITAFSRRGLLSRSNLSGSGDPWPGEYDRGSLRQRLRQIREDIARAEQQGLAWQVVMDAVRNQGQRIWQGLTALEGDAQRLTLTLALRYGEAQRVSADHVILTTGPAHGALTDSQPLLRQLSQDGLIRADAFGLGLDVDLRSRAIGREGQANPKLLVSGPAARARFGELMGLPQVADHAADVAAEALQTLGVKQSVRCPAF